MSRVRDLPGDHRGSASVLAVVLLGVLAATALLVAAIGGVVVDQRRVAAAADLGALAAASALQQGRTPVRPRGPSPGATAPGWPAVRSRGRWSACG